MPTHREPPVRDRTLDVALVLFTLGFTLLQMRLGGGFGDFADASTQPDALAYALAALSAIALLWRRQFPWTVLVATLTLSAASAAFGYGVHAPLAPAVAIYTFGVAPRGVPTWHVAATAACGWAVLIGIELATTPYGVPDYVLPALIWGGAWLLGDRQRVLAARASDRVERARQDQELVVAAERARIARELHDSAGHAVNTILIQAGAARVLWGSDDERALQSVAAIEEVARETIDEIDRIVGLLREEEADIRSPLPGIEDISALVERLRASGLDVQFKISGSPDPPPPPAVSRAVYRIAQESLTNASRHGVGTADVALDLGSESLELSVENPIAFKVEPRRSGGRGIDGMRERARLLGGSLSAQRNGALFHLEAVLPYESSRR